VEHLEGVVSNIIPISTFNIMNTNQKTVIHDVESRQELDIPFDLLHKQMSLLGSQLQFTVPVDPVEILLSRSGVVVQLLITDRSAQGRALQIVCLVDISVRREDIAHDHKVNLAAVRQFHAMQSKETTQQRMRILFNMLRNED